MRHLNILFTEDYLGSYPSIINALHILDSNNINTNLFLFRYKTKFPELQKFKNVYVNYFTRYGVIDRYYELNDSVKSNPLKWIDKFFNKFEIGLFFKIKETFLSLPKTLLKIKDLLCIFSLILRHRESFRNGYYTICIDSNALICTFLINKLFNCKFKIIFWSLEITTYNELDFFDIFLKKMEFYSLKASNFIVSQSKERLFILNNSHKAKFSQNKSIFIPHSRLKPSNINRKFFFNQKFKIGKQHIVVLHLGWIHDVMDSYNLSNSTLRWDSNYHLILHERAKRSHSDPYIHRISALNSNSLHLSLNPVPYNELGTLIQSCDVGLVIYNPTNYGSSWENIAKASGKLADYLAFGKPVICSNLPDLKELMTEYKCGFCFNSLSEIPTLISKILDDYSYYSENALKCFDEEFNFSKSFAPLMDIITISK